MKAYIVYSPELEQYLSYKNWTDKIENARLFGKTGPAKISARAHRHVWNRPYTYETPYHERYTTLTSFQLIIMHLTEGEIEPFTIT